MHNTPDESGQFNWTLEDNTTITVKYKGQYEPYIPATYDSPEEGDCWDVEIIINGPNPSNDELEDIEAYAERLCIDQAEYHQLACMSAGY